MLIFKTVPITKDEILNIPKTVNDNGCWIPISPKPESNGYVRISVDYQRYGLHRLSMCIFHNIDYNNPKIESRHLCRNPTCFNPEHVIPGTKSDNTSDQVRDGTHLEARRTNCEYCGSKLVNVIIKTGPKRGYIYRRCRHCIHRDRRLKNAKSKLD